MVQRNISVTVGLEAQKYLSGLDQIQKKTRETSKEAQVAFGLTQQQLEKVGKAAGIASVGFTAATVAMIKAAADFQGKLSQISALGSEYSSSIGKLSQAAFTAGKAFGLSASQVADAQIELAKAGVSARDILGGALPGALALASAGQIDVAKATAIASTAMTQFGKAGSAVPHIADLLAASADKSVASVDSVGDALNQSGLVAAQFGLSIEDTVGTLTAFSKAGLNGSDAGTSFKTMLLSLASPSKQAKAALDEYNISAYDAQGKFVGITSLAKQLQDGFHGVDQASRDSALSIIFGTDAVRAANVLYKQGANITQGFADGQNVAGFAALSAAKKLDNLNGDLQKLSASFQNDLIGAGTSGQAALRGVTQSATGLLDVFGSLPTPVQGTALAVTAVGAAVTAAGAAFVLLAPKVVAAKAAMADLNLTGKSLAVGFAKGAALSAGIAAVTSGIAALGAQGETTSEQLNLAAKSAKTGFSDVDSLFKGNAFGGAKGAADALKRSFSGNFFENDSAGTKFIDGLTFGLTRLSDTYKSNEGQFKALGEQFGALAATDYSTATYQFARFVDAVGGGTDAAKEALSAFPAYKQSIVELLNASGQAATEQNILAAATGTGGVASKIQAAQDAAAKNAAALQEMSGAAVGATGDINKLADTIAGFGSVTLDARAAQRDFQAAVDDAAAAAKKNGRSLDISTEAGRANQDALDNIAGAATKAAAAILKSGGSAEDAAGAIRSGRKAFIDAAVQMGLTRDKAKKLADQLNLIPGNVSTAVKVTGVDAAKATIADVRRQVEAINGLRANILVNVTKQGVDALNAQNYTRRAAGGPITGPGPKGKDSVLIYAAPGEHVLTASEVDKMGGQAGVYAFRQQLHAYAKGGAIGDATSDATAAQRSADAYQRKIITAKGYLAKAQKAANAADRAADKASDDSSKIYGKGTGQAKHDAAQRARSLKQKADAAGKLVDQLEKQIDDLRKNRDDQRDKATAANDRAQTLRDSSVDFVSSQRRATSDNPIDPLSYIDQLRSMSRDDNYSKTRQATYAKAADQYEQSIVDLTTKSKDAAAQLDVLKDRAAQVQDTMGQMRSSIASAISGGYGIGGAKTADTTTDAFTELVQTGFKDLYGVSVATYNQVQHDAVTTPGGYTAGGIDAYFAQASNATGEFANDLQTLANRGVNGQLLAQIAGYGVDQGAPIAKALLSGTAGQIASINQNYANVQDRADMAGGIVSDYNYGALVKAAQDQVVAAQASADQITAQLRDDGEKLRKLIASAFGLTGYAVGTMNATPGWHLVGEQGPELLRMRGGEQVTTAAASRQLLTTSRVAAPMQVTGPSSVTVVDADGVLVGSFTTAARSVARAEIHANAAIGAVAYVGGGV